MLHQVGPLVPDLGEVVVLGLVVGPYPLHLSLELLQLLILAAELRPQLLEVVLKVLQLGTLPGEFILLISTQRSQAP